MELTDTVLAAVRQSIPTDFAIYRFEEGRIVPLYTSPALPAMSGMTEEEYQAAAGRDAALIVLDGDRQRVAEKLGAMLRDGGDADFSYRILHKTLGSVWVHAKGRALGELDGCPVFLTMFLNTADEAEGHSFLLNHSTSIVYAVDRATHELLYANAPALAAWGHTAYGGTTCHRFICGQDAPCPWCPIPRMKNGTYHDEAYHNPEQDKWFRLDCREMDWRGRPAAAVYAVDITASKEEEARREKVRRMYEAAVGDVNLVVWEYEIGAHRIIMADNEFTEYDYRKFGLPKIIENAPDSLAEYIDEADVQKFLDMYRAIENGAPKASCEVWYKLQPGQEPRCERISFTTVFGADGKPVSAVGIGQNITARKMEEEKYNRFYKQLSEANPDTLGSFRMNLSADWCGDGQSPQADYLRLQSSGRVNGFFAAMASRMEPGEARDEFIRFFTRENLLEVFQSGTAQLTREFLFSDSPRGVRWGKGTINMVQNPQTGDVEAVTYTQNITEQKKEETIAQRLTNEIIDYIGLIDLEGQTFEFRNVNRAIQGLPVRRKMDYSVCIAYDLKTFVMPGDRDIFTRCTALTHLREELAEAPSYAFAYGHQECGGEYRKQLLYSYLDETKKDILVIQADVTDAYRQEQEQLRRTKEALDLAEQANHAKTEFLSRISHDIRTPISIISSMTEFAHEDRNEPEKLEHDLEKIRAANRFLLSLINDVLDISKIDSGKIGLNPEPYPYEEYIANIRNMFGPLCREKNINFVTSRQRNKGVILADKVRLNQIVLNLISNAVKYTPEGGTVAYRSESEDLPDGTIRCAFEISDTGIGMSEEFQKIMFEPFMQEYDNPNRPKVQNGTGLGLSIVKRMVDLMGGTLTVKSALGKGTAVHCEMRFPNVSAAPGQTLRDEGELAAAPPVRLTGKALLAEDNDINAEIAERILASFGLTMERAENGGVAVEKFASSASGEYRAILMDIQMPVMNGYEAVQAIRALPRPDARTVPILAMTANAFADDVEKCLRAGMNGHIAKPIDPDVLASELTKYLRDSNDCPEPRQ